MVTVYKKGLKEGQPTEEARVLLGESNGNLKLMATLDDDADFEVESIEVVNNLTDKIMEGVIEIMS